MNHKFLRLATVSLLFAIVQQVSFAQKTFEKSHVLINGAAALQHEDAAPMLSAEYGVTNQIGLGIRTVRTWTSNGYNILTPGVFANYHFFQSRKVDPFAGVLLDKEYYTENVRQISPSSQPFIVNAQVGGRYLFTNRLGIYGQAIAPLRRGFPFRGEVGLSLKL
jgi:hypothetical protein